MDDELVDFDGDIIYTDSEEETSTSEELIEDPELVKSFFGLPEELQTKIFRQKAAVPLKKYQSQLSLDERIHDASIAGITKSEVEWLAGNGGYFYIFYSNGKYAKIDERGWGKLTEVLTTNLYYSENETKINYKTEMPSFRAPINGDPIDIIINNLVGRSGPEVIKASRNRVKKMKLGPYVRENDENSVYANIVMLDLKHMLLIFRNRFDIVIPDRAIELSRRAAQQILDDTVDILAPPRSDSDDPKQSKLPALLLYLMMNTFGVGEDINVTLNMIKQTLTHNYLDKLENDCRTAYEKLTQVISKWE